MLHCDQFLTMIFGARSQKIFYVEFCVSLYKSPALIFHWTVQYIPVQLDSQCPQLDAPLIPFFIINIITTPLA